ncbi:MAG: BadF/BadG/BcrA/BcrD ATPase family protein [Sulfolobales archaeon]
MERLVLVGVDSGATKTEAVGIDMASQVCVFTTESSSNPSVIGIEKASTVIARAVEKVLAGLGYGRPTLYLVAVGTAGVVNKSYADVLRKRLLELSGISVDRVVVFEDVVAAHASVFLSSDGIVGVLGTGSCVYGEFAGHSVRVGGWGHLLGDEGSGYRLGLKSLREVLECLDGLKECSSLATMIARSMGFSSTSDVLSYVYYSENPKTAVASLATMVMKAYRDGDKTAAHIVESEIDEFVKQVAAVIRKIGVSSPKVGFTGSVYMENRELLRHLLKKKLEELLGIDIEIFEQKVRASCGAIIAGLKLKNDSTMLARALNTIEKCCLC